MTTAQTTATLTEDAYDGFKLQLGDVEIQVEPVAGDSLNAVTTDPEVQVDLFMVNSGGARRCALTERVKGIEQLRSVLAQWRAILS